MRRVRILFVACALLGLTSAAAGQESLLSYGNAAPVPEALGLESRTAESATPAPLDLRVRLEMPSYRSLPSTDPLAAVSMTPYVPGSVRVKYRGLRRVALKHITRRYIAELGDKSAYHAPSLRRVLDGKESTLRLRKRQILVTGRARGRLLGGNLTVLSHLMGTRFAPDLRDCVLLLEEGSMTTILPQQSKPSRPSKA